MKPEKLFPAAKDYVWGGTKLRQSYGKISDGDVVAETWELSFHPDGPVLLSDGSQLSRVATASELGENVADFPFFPTLIKFIDAAADLSVQVHPSDEYALKNENSFGKTEMWYIVEAEPGAGIYMGFNRDVTKEEYEAAIKANKLCELLNFYEVKTGECYFIPSGTIHAIGKGCLICEIQQNSNLTYRVYDYGRVDKEGRPRPLHVEKALEVTSLKRFAPTTCPGDYLGVSKYFSVKKYTVNGSVSLTADKKSYQCITCLKGSGKCADLDMKKGESIFVPAGFGAYAVEGDAEIILTEVRKLYVGIDLGGTFIKGCIANDRGELIVTDKAPTERERGSAAVAKNIADLTMKMLAAANLTTSDVCGIGMGVPGMIDGSRGEVVYSNNFGWRGFKIADAVGALTGLQVKISNDANVAALGEVKFGSAKEYKNAILITLGTGVGGGVVLDGKIYEGNRGAGAELGHTVIAAGGELCNCGRRGCLEAYASATALIRDTKRKMEENKDSLMWQVGSLDAVDGKTAFDYMEKDKYAKEVVDRYVEMLGVGLANFANEFRPEVILLGGGVCAQGDNLIVPLQKYVDKEIFAHEMGPRVKILKAELENLAGVLGGVSLLCDDSE